MSKKKLFPILILGTYVMVLCSALTYISFVALGAEEIFINAFKHFNKLRV